MFTFETKITRVGGESSANRFERSQIIGKSGISRGQKSDCRIFQKRLSVVNLEKNKNVRFRLRVTFHGLTHYINRAALNGPSCVCVCDPTAVN